ncbi:hypothetical protein E2562_011593 [Oryza meyeriana var. granulata]|uniref:Uncharacterized protein n=1 Tax=Oryza meyeriana var. granulata TaxID=110450 RepID=A0A6G1DXC6_9ORYZ|nr:hypothetical protein E2562_011593 [Oryza meyeriana var. granulata]
MALRIEWTLPGVSPRPHLQEVSIVRRQVGICSNNNLIRQANVLFPSDSEPWPVLDLQACSPGVIFFPWPAHLVEFQLPEGICSKSEGDMYCPAYAQFIKCHSLSTVIVNMACTFMCTCWSYYHDNIQSW